MSLLLRIAELVLNRPLLVHPDKVPLILGVLQGRIPIEDTAEWRAAAEARIAEMPEDAQAVMRGPAPGASRFVGSFIDSDPVTGVQTKLPYRRNREGVAMIPVIGSLINRGAWIGSSSGETSYEGIKFQLSHAAGDPKTTAVLLDIESPGGEAVGAFEAAASVRALAAAKPVTAIVNGMAASAAYAIASGASRIVTTQTGVVGSIGVVLLHADFSRQIDKAGVTPTLIFAGAHKVDGNPFEPLSDDVRDDLQAEVNQFYELFVQTVAEGRRKMSAAMIRGTEARTFIGADAVDRGLADELGTFESALADLTDARVGQSPTGRLKMANEKTAPDASGTFTQVQLDAAVAAARTEGVTAGKAEMDTAIAAAQKAGATAERARVAAIAGLAEAKGREAQAIMIATTTDLTADQAKAVLAASPKLIVGRAGEATLGITLEDKKPGETAGAAPWDDVVASVNKSFAPRTAKRA
jgi:signal peptide peptidase SppA